MKQLSKKQIKEFQYKIYEFYKHNRRSFEWREQITPYGIVVSEIMLQQTQTSRVISKFSEWMKKFPNFRTLAQASKQDVLLHWQGLGYNRRGLALHGFAKRVVDEFNGIVPKDPEILESFKGIGTNTAGSICAFAFNKPIVFIETNIRTIFIHEFFKEHSDIHDKELLPLIQQTIDTDNARDWYYALMDYGVHLKTKHKISNKRSKHYAKQSKFEGSQRQVRGAVIRLLSKSHTVSYDELQQSILLELPENKHDLRNIVQHLQRDGFLQFKDNFITLLP